MLQKFKYYLTVASFMIFLMTIMLTIMNLAVLVAEW